MLENSYKEYLENIEKAQVEEIAKLKSELDRATKLEKSQDNLIIALKDKLHRRNMQIKDLKVKQYPDIFYYVCKNAEANIMARDNWDSTDKKALKFIDEIVKQ